LFLARDYAEANDQLNRLNLWFPGGAPSEVSSACLDRVVEVTGEFMYGSPPNAANAVIVSRIAPAGSVMPGGESIPLCYESREHE
jgi:hypothetical protein